jgi:hypothetical protein
MHPTKDGMSKVFKMDHHFTVRVSCIFITVLKQHNTLLKEKN